MCESLGTCRVTFPLREGVVFRTTARRSGNTFRRTAGPRLHVFRLRQTPPAALMFESNARKRM